MFEEMHGFLRSHEACSHKDLHKMKSLPTNIPPQTFLPAKVFNNFSGIFRAWSLAFFAQLWRSKQSHESPNTITTRPKLNQKI
jgi:hypothetical protein